MVKLQVVLLFGVYGALRLAEITNVTTDDIKDHNGLLLVDIPETKTKVRKSFVIRGPYYELIKKYEKKRPSDPLVKRFFLNYQSGICTKQVKQIIIYRLIL